MKKNKNIYLIYMSELKKKSARRIPKPIEMRKKADADKLKLRKDKDDKDDKKWDVRMHMRKDKDDKNTYKKWDLQKDKKADLGKLDNLGKKIYYLSNTSYVDDGKKRMEKHLEVKSNGTKKNAYYVEKENGNVKVELDNVKKIESYLKKH
jgi:hypothetical protein